jgi:hypothetical protein
MNKSLIFKIFIFIILLITIDQVIGFGLRKLYFTQKSGSAYHTTYAIDSTRADILIFGSSQANHHYVPEVFEKGLGLTYYNTGRDGMDFLYDFAVFKSILKRYTPKIIIIDLRPNDLQFHSEGYDLLSALLPYYTSHCEIQNTVKLRSQFEKFKMISATYPFNSTFLNSFVFNLNFSKGFKSNRKGFIPLKGTSGLKNPGKYWYPITMVDPNKIQAIDSISKVCLNKNITLLFCFSPFFVERQKTKMDTLLSSLALRDKFVYMDFSGDSSFTNHPELFRDESHLNNEGAMIYSTRLLDSISIHRVTGKLNPEISDSK